MLGFDIAVALLIVGILVLCTTTAVSILPWRESSTPTRRHTPASRTGQARQAVRPIEASHRRAVTGHPASMERLALTVGRPDDLTTDSQSGAISDIDAAEALIDRLLQTDPELVAALMTQWIHQDVAQPESSVATTESADVAQPVEVADATESPLPAAPAGPEASPQLAALFPVAATAGRTQPGVDPNGSALAQHVETN